MVHQIIMDLKPGDGKGIYISNAEDNKFSQQTNYAARDVPDTESFKIEKLDVRGHEAYYISNAENRQLIWIEEDAGGKALQYEIVGSDMSQEWVLNIAESMIE